METYEKEVQKTLNLQRCLFEEEKIGWRGTKDLRVGKIFTP